jgi:hypothetical protein
MTLPCTIGLRVVDGVEILDSQGIVCQLYNTDVIKASPDKVLLVELLHIAGVDTVLHTYLGATEYLSLIRKLGGSVSNGYTYTGTGTVTPKSRSVETHIFAVYIADVGSPEAIGIFLAVAIGINIRTVIPSRTRDNAGHI